MKLHILGMGIVGLATGITFAKKGYELIFSDISNEIVEKFNEGEVLVYEKDMEENVKKIVNEKKAYATTDVKSAVKKSKFSFVCIGTPEKSCFIDLSRINDGVKAIANALKEKDEYHVVVIKSTVPPLTTEKVFIPLLERIANKKVGKDIGLCMNPEFLREGEALSSTMKPDRIIIGEYDRKSGKNLLSLYKKFNSEKLRVEIRVAEMIKCASNAFLGMKVAYANEIANLCEKLGIDVYEVMKGVGLDKRINKMFLRAGCGFGGSCLPKDIKSLVHIAKKNKVNVPILKAVIENNEKQPLRVVEIAGDVKGKKAALLGLSFKPGTDDVRNTCALKIYNELISRGANVVVYDPKAMKNFLKIAHNAKKAENLHEAIDGKEICIIQTEWDEFKKLKPEEIKKLMKKPVIIDGRRTFNPNKLIKEGIIYKGIGWKDNDSD
ncbi:MAG: UDP-glucose/GDP-mannose dehydrogenase family protein [Candidatus Thermoplasmatota archaeon]